MGFAFSGVAPENVEKAAPAVKRGLRSKYVLEDNTLIRSIGKIVTTVHKIPKKDGGHFFKADVRIVNQDVLFDGMFIMGINVIVGEDSLTVSAPNDKYNQNGFVGGGVNDLMLASAEAAVRRVLQDQVAPVFTERVELTPSEIRLAVFRIFENAGFIAKKKFGKVPKELVDHIVGEMVHAAEMAYIDCRSEYKHSNVKDGE